MEKLGRVLLALSCFLSVNVAMAVTPLSTANLQPAGNASWTTSALTGIAGTSRELEIVEEQTQWTTKNWLLFDVQRDGFPGAVGTTSNDQTVFIPANPVGTVVLLTVPTNANVALFLDAEDGSGAKGTGPNGVLNPLDAYLNSDPVNNRTKLTASQYLKYYLADPTQSYSFTVNGQTSQLGNGCVAFIFADDDHAGANFDYNDMIVCVRGCLTNAECSDGLYCSGEEVCVSGQCQDGVPVSCDDGVECTVDICVEETQTCKNKATNAPCSDGLWCNGYERCDPLLGCQADQYPPSCDDGVPCTVDVCNEQTDSCDHTPNHTPCSDGQFCNGVEVCHPLNGCQAGAPRNCDDTIPCTIDACNEATDTCTHQPVNSVCNDNKFCNGFEVCDLTKGCKAGMPVNCADNVGCTVDRCDEATRSCIRTPDPSLCDDGQYCNGIEICSATQGCKAGPPPACTDDIPCTFDSCDEATNACIHQPDPAPCSDGLYCNGIEVCDPTLGCQSSDPPVCDDTISCTQDTCDEQIDTCVYTPSGELCDNGLYCDGEEYCDPVMGCQPGIPPCPSPLKCVEDFDICVDCATDGQCDDGVFCNGLETCVSNECVPGAPPNCSDTVACTTDSCDPATDQCIHVPNHSSCANGVYCDGMEICNPLSGCAPGPVVNCDDHIACTNDSCNEIKDVCEHTPTPAICSNGVYCDGVEVCDPFKGCLPGPAVICNDGVFCTADQCNESADRCDHIPMPSVCEDSLYCNGIEVCNLRGDCQAGPPVSCADAFPCTNDICDESSNSCIHVPNSAQCDDGAYCNGLERCDLLAGCQAGTAPNCSDGITCTNDFCVESTDSCDHVPINSLCSDGQFCNGAEVCAVLSGCQANPPPSCPGDEVVCTSEFCNEAADSCDFTLDDESCDDGDPCTVNMCTPGGCSVVEYICGACCNGDTNLCTDHVTQDQCVCERCQWTFGKSCSEVGCRDNVIPTVSQWGLAVLSLLLLIAAKLRFAARTGDRGMAPTG